MFTRFFSLTALLLVFSSAYVVALRIAVIGAGPSGLFFTLQLLNATQAPVCHIDIFDARDDPRLASKHKSYAIGITPRSWQAISSTNAIGLMEHLQDEGACKILSSAFIQGWNKPKPNPTARIRYMTNQPMFSSALLNYLGKKSIPSYKGKVTFRFNTKCLHIDPTLGRVVFQPNQDTHQLQSKDYDLVIGADGSLSVARLAVMNQRGVSYEALDHAVRWKFLPVEMGSTHLNRSAFFLNVEGINGGWWNMYPSGRVHMVMFWTPEKKITELDNPDCFNTPAKAEKFLTHVLGRRPENIEEIAAELVASKASGESIFKISQYHHNSGKVVLVGDAAHLMSSALGQGMTTSLEDASTLIECLNASQYNTTLFPEALKRYSELRVPEGHAVTDLNYVYVAQRESFFSYLLDSLLKKVLFNRENLILAVLNPSKRFSETKKDYEGWIEVGKRAMLSRNKNLQRLLQAHDKSY